jgi:hypothetical protein
LPAGPGPRTATISSIPNYLYWAIVCAVFFFTPAGVIGIICSVVARRRAAAGDIDGALRASHTAKTCCWVSLILGLVAYLLVVLGVLHLPTAGT